MRGPIAAGSDPLSPPNPCCGLAVVLVVPHPFGEGSRLGLWSFSAVPIWLSRDTESRTSWIGNGMSTPTPVSLSSAAVATAERTSCRSECWCQNRSSTTTAESSRGGIRADGSREKQHSHQGPRNGRGSDESRGGSIEGERKRGRDNRDCYHESPKGVGTWVKHLVKVLDESSCESAR
jgi:hypothetical protein